MKSLKSFSIIIAMLFAIFLTACDGMATDDRDYFESRLRGTWVSNDPGVYSGKLTIDYDTIIIEGYAEDWTSQWGDDSKRPFKDYPKGIPLNGYSEKGEVSGEGEIFIEFPASKFTSVSYEYTEAGSYPQKYKLLTFNFGDRKEILQCKVNY